MYFGWCSLPGIFQQMINSIFWELLHKGVLENYINVIVYLNTNIFLLIFLFLNDEEACDHSHIINYII